MNFDPESTVDQNVSQLVGATAGSQITNIDPTTTGATVSMSELAEPPKTIGTTDTANIPMPKFGLSRGAEHLGDMKVAMSGIQNAMTQTQNSPSPKPGLSAKDMKTFQRVQSLLKRGRMTPHAFALLTKITGKLGTLMPIMSPVEQAAMSRMQAVAKERTEAPAPRQNYRVIKNYAVTGDNAEKLARITDGHEAVDAAKLSTKNDIGHRGDHAKLKAITAMLPPEQRADGPKPGNDSKKKIEGDTAEGSFAMKNDRKAAQKWYGHAYALNADLAPHPN